MLTWSRRRIGGRRLDLYSSIVRVEPFKRVKTWWIDGPEMKKWKPELLILELPLRKWSRFRTLEVIYSKTVSPTSAHFIQIIYLCRPSGLPYLLGEVGCVRKAFITLDRTNQHQRTKTLFISLFKSNNLPLHRHNQQLRSHQITPSTNQPRLSPISTSYTSRSTFCTLPGAAQVFGTLLSQNPLLIFHP